MKVSTVQAVTLVLFTVCFVFQLIPLLTVPISQGLLLAKFQGYKFGVFGWCYVDRSKDIQICRHSWKSDSGPDAKYSLKLLFPSLYRIALSKLLVVHPIAFAFTCTSWLMSMGIAFTKYGYNPRFVLLAAVWSMFTFVLSLLAFLVDLLLFVNKLEWPGWLILASTVILAFQCSMLWTLRRKVTARQYVNCGQAQQFHRLDRERLCHIQTVDTASISFEDVSSNEVYPLERVPYPREELSEPENSYYTHSFIT